jgi:hypothetical protein
MVEFHLQVLKSKFIKNELYPRTKIQHLCFVPHQLIGNGIYLTGTMKGLGETWSGYMTLQADGCLSNSGSVPIGA